MAIAPPLVDVQPRLLRACPGSCRYALEWLPVYYSACFALRANGCAVVRPDVVALRLRRPAGKVDNQCGWPRPTVERHVHRSTLAAAHREAVERLHASFYFAHSASGIALNDRAAASGLRIAPYAVQAAGSPAHFALSALDRVAASL